MMFLFAVPAVGVLRIMLLPQKRRWRCHVATKSRDCSASRWLQKPIERMEISVVAH
jgi:hypothetical protein